MTVYVDDMHSHTLGKFGRMKMSHMIADTVDELHTMAGKIGVDRRHFQAPPRHFPHYDIALLKRHRAVELGAVEVTMRELAKMIRGKPR